MTKVMLELHFLPYVFLKLLCTYMKRVSLNFFTLRAAKQVVKLSRLPASHGYSTLG